MPKLTPAPDNQPELIAEPRAEYTVTPQQQAEKDSYRERLRLHLKDPAFRQIEGFPIGEDDAILALSDPPFYTACPNPFLGEIIEKWRQERAALRQELDLPVDSPILQAGEGEGVIAEPYHREPFAADVSEGKNDPIYNAHSYHTKVPHKAIMRYILHYTDPGDIVLDGFCGTGMTGVAAQMCNDKKTVESLGYTVQKNGLICDEKGEPFSRLGPRKAVLVDLSPAATFIAYNYNTPVDARAFEKEARRILAEVEKECGWMYETWHPHCDDPNRVKGKINYIIWSDVFICPQCGTEMVFWDVAVDFENGVVRDVWNCLGCATRLAKSPKKESGSIKAERVWETSFDRTMGKIVKHIKQVPVLINYFFGKQRFEKRPDIADQMLINKIGESIIPYTIPFDPLPIGDKTGDPIKVGITHVHHFYTKRNLWVLARIKELILSLRSEQKHYLMFMLNSIFSRASRMSRVAMSNFLQGGGGPIMTAMSGTLYIPSFSVENSILKLLHDRLEGLIRALSVSSGLQIDQTIIGTQSATQIYPCPPSAVDYVFVDPPFGENIMYSELNFLSEAWKRVYTNASPEAIVNKSQKKDLRKYQGLMERCFLEYYRIIKPGHWITVEFHNSSNSVWNAIQEGLLQTGFVVADVRILDKQQGTFNQVTASGSVKQDLIISAYKPRTEFEQRFLKEGGSIQGAWDFTRQHLEQLPIPALEDGIMETLVERQGYLLYDRMIAFHIQRGLSVPLSAPEFYAGLPQRFLDRDGMYFTPVQAAEYDRRRLGAQKVEQLSLFVSDEKSALLWLRRELNPETGGGPQTYQDLQPKFIRELHQARHEALPELRTILEQNFLQDQTERWYVPNPERQADLDGLRQKALLREYGEYMQGKGRLKVFRSEAVRAGFSHAWKERDYAAILKVAERLPETVLQEDQNLLMYVHNAALRQQEQPRQMPLI